MNLLSTIISHKKAEIAWRKACYPVPFLEAQVYYAAPPLSLKQNLLSNSGIIAEFKRKSPSKGAINLYASVEEVTRGYRQAGVSGISVLTDDAFFGGSNQDLQIARQWNHCPILRKDFILDPYQIIEAKAIGADAILLIARILEANNLQSFTELAHNLGMEVLVEIHDPMDIEKLPKDVDMIGVNNRNLHDGAVDLRHAHQLIARLPKNVLKVAESGISSINEFNLLRDIGYQGFLIGTFFMQQASPAAACEQFIAKIGGIYA